MFVYDAIRVIIKKESTLPQDYLKYVIVQRLASYYTNNDFLDVIINFFIDKNRPIEYHTGKPKKV